MGNYPQTSQEPECVEAEVVYNGGDRTGRERGGFSSGRSGGAEEAESAAAGLKGTSFIASALRRFSIAIGSVIALIGFAITALGVILTSSVIGAVIGVPLIIIGVFLLAVAFRLFFFRSGNTVIFRKFP